VAAADSWDGPVKIKRVNPGLPHSYEGLLHQVGLPHFALDLLRRSQALEAALVGPLLERAIGVIYKWAQLPAGASRVLCCWLRRPKAAAACRAGCLTVGGAAAAAGSRLQAAGCRLQSADNSNL
jgi:hypothetical protein